jgi:hypothetical protein
MQLLHSFVARTYKEGSADHQKATQLRRLLVRVIDGHEPAPPDDEDDNDDDDPYGSPIYRLNYRRYLGARHTTPPGRCRLVARAHEH